MIGYIYKIKCRDTNEFYIGSTTNISNRYRYYNNKYNKHNLSVSKNIIERNNYDFIIIESRNFTNNLSMLLLENIYILIGKKYKKCINKNLAYRTHNIKKYMENNYRKENKEQTKLNRDNYRKRNAEKVKIRETNYRIKNREIINKKQNEKIKCDNCSLMITKQNILRHKKSKKCLNYNG
tara:strand:+ start:343 stop:882 length:540 start_codon:yes stop_codon:yes gene_type:complete